MKDTMDALPGIERIKERFIGMLQERQTTIAQHALSAWKSTDPTKAAAHLETAQGILHQISGSAGSLGFHDLGQAARNAENAIIAHLGDPSSELIDAVELIDGFVGEGQKVIAQR